MRGTATIGLVLPLVLTGCGEPAKGTPQKLERKITMEEYRKMTPDEQRDPFVLDNLEKPPEKGTPAARGGAQR